MNLLLDGRVPRLLASGGGIDVRSRPERRSARMVLDVDFALEWPLTDVLRAELDQGVEVHVVLLHRRRGWSVDSAPVSLHRRRIAAARRSRLEELARIAGARHRQVTVSIQRHRWWAAEPGQSLAYHLTTTSSDPCVPVLLSAEPLAPLAADPGRVRWCDRGRGAGRDLAAGPRREEGSA